MTTNSERILAPWQTDPDDTFIAVEFDIQFAEPEVGIYDAIFIYSVTLDDGTEIEPTKDQKDRIIEELWDIRRKRLEEPKLDCWEGL